MVERGERWPPVYDLDDLVAEIKRLTERHDIATGFHEWPERGSGPGKR
jgi:hypothetical protein